MREVFALAKNVIIIGGVATAAMAGRGAVEMLCREDGRKFTACTP